MGALREKFRKAREFEVTAGGIVWTVRRPTNLEMVRLQQSGGFAEGMTRFVIGWKKPDGAFPSEIDLGFPNGDPHPLEFDAEDCAEILSDRLDVYQTIVEATTEQYAKHASDQKDAAKN